ncbi:MAG: insulinase family protein [Clostridiales bacterium]|nr:insulinase family protein [Clostridiales bacterium]
MIDNMKIVESTKIKEKAYFEKLENGLNVIIIPKKNTNKKYVIWGTNFGSIDNNFIMPDNGEEVKIPDGVAHFLEHKMFEQSNGTNSLDVLMALGLEANAYTTNDHTAYLFECSNDKFYEGLDELMDYVQNPYFTDENVEKEKGIIGQEIMMYDDDPGFQLYLNTMDCMYHKNAVKLDIAGTIDSISKINPDILYKCYNTFYHPSNMTLVVCGDFEPQELLNEIIKRLKNKNNQGKIKRIYEVEDETINKCDKKVEMEVSMPIFMIGYKDCLEDSEEIVKKHIAIEILLNMLLGKSSNLYKELYNSGKLISEPDFDYEFSKQYAHILISGQSKDYNEIYKKIKEQVNNYKNNGLDSDHFERIKRKIYGDYVSEYNSVSDIARMFLADSFKGINSFDYIEKYNEITKQYVEQILKEVFIEDKMVLSVINPK